MIKHSLDTNTNFSFRPFSLLAPHNHIYNILCFKEPKPLLNPYKFTYKSCLSTTFFLYFSYFFVGLNIKIKFITFICTPRLKHIIHICLPSICCWFTVLLLIMDYHFKLSVDFAKLYNSFTVGESNMVFYSCCFYVKFNN